jgi:pantoate--beta-alanine ligase
LEKCGATLVFAPSVEEIYPEPDTRQFSYAPLDTVMEGKYRPGHFNGVCQIVSKLFLMVEPDRAYFGDADSGRKSGRYAHRSPHTPVRGACRKIIGA